jgi:O-antigen/teichoic acid export membrane protein
MAEKVLRLLVGLFIGVYVARYLGPEQFGVLSFSMSFVALFGAFGKLGLNGIVVRNAVQNPENRDELLGTAFVLRFIGGLALIVAVFSAIHFTDVGPHTKLIVMIIAVGHVLQAFEVIDFYFQSQVLARLISIAGIISLFISSIIKLVLIWSEASLVWFAWVVVVEQGVKAIVLCVAYIAQRISLWQWRFRFSQARLLLRDSWPLILSGFLIMIYMRIDQVMIKMMLNDEAVGQYAAAVRLLEVWYFLPVAITQSIFPAILFSKEKGEKFYYKHLQRMYDFMVWLAILIALPMSFLSGRLVTLLYGTQYYQASGVLTVSIWASIFVFTGVANSRWLLSENMQLFSLFRTFCGAFVNIVLNLFLIPKLGIYGAAIATLFSQIFSSYLSFAFTKKTIITFKMQTLSFAWPYRIIKLYHNAS